ncbi:hypothetical protein JZU46_02915 [bacterium]|nr:hypothetical protein [bacterium]
MATKYTPPTGSINFICRKVITLPKTASVNFIFKHSDSIGLGSYLNIVSLEDFPAFIRANKQEYSDLIGFSRAASESYSGFSCSITVTSDYIVHQVFTKGDYVYIAAERGTDIVNINTGLSVYFKETLAIRTITIWGNEDTLFVAGINGLFQIDYIDLHNDYVYSAFKTSFPISAEPTYIHGKDKQLLVCTVSGIDYINYTRNPTIKSSCIIDNVSKCFMTTTKAYYITHNTISGSVYAAINRKDNLLTDWSIASKIYMSGDGILPKDIYLTDIFVTETTAFYGGNTIFCTTTSGIYIIDEDTTEYMLLNIQ